MNKAIAFLSLIFMFCTEVLAEESDELLIGTVRSENTKLPGTSLKRPADYIVQRLRVSSESKEEKVRKEEIFETLRSLVAASKEKGIEPCNVVDSRVVIPLKIDAATLKIVRGGRLDTSEVSVCIKVKVIPGVANAVVQFSKLREFPANIKTAGRSAIDLQGEIDVSVINPAQYREQVIKLYANDAKLVTASLTADYRIITRGIDRQLQWLRDGMTDVVFYIPYEYDVVPVNVTTVPRASN